MSKSHNKKRNVGIIYELLLRYISNSLINNDKTSAQKALNIIETRFDKSSELYKEFRLFNALAKSTVSDTPVAAAILTEAKSAARRCDIKKLNYEKSLLIKDINYKLSDKNFYYRRIPEYKTYATIQTLLNDWRKLDKSNLTRMIEYESKIVSHLLINKNDQETLSEIKNSNENVDSLVVKIMTEKINKKYGNNLNDEQKTILGNYVFNIRENNLKEIHRHLVNVKKQTLKSLESLKRSTDNSILLEKIEQVRQKLNSIPIDKINDDTISKFLTISKLKEEITKEEKWAIMKNLNY